MPSKMLCQTVAEGPMWEQWLRPQGELTQHHPPPYTKVTQAAETLIVVAGQV